MINIFRSAFAMAALTLFLAAAPFGAFAQQGQPAQPENGLIQVKIAVIDLDGVRANAAAVKSIRDQVEAYRKAIQADIQKEEDALRKANEELARQRAILSPEAFDAERSKFEGRVAALQRKVQDSKQALDKVYGDAMDKVNQELMGAITDIASANNITLLIRKNAVVLNATAFDISPAVLKRLNERLPAVTVAKPAAGG